MQNHGNKIWKSLVWGFAAGRVQGSSGFLYKSGLLQRGHLSAQPFCGVHLQQNGVFSRLSALSRPNLSLPSRCSRSANTMRILCCTSLQCSYKSTSGTSDSNKDVKKLFDLTVPELPGYSMVPLEYLMESSKTVQQVLHIIYPVLLQEDIGHKEISMIFKSLKRVMIEELSQQLPCDDTILLSKYVTYCRRQDNKYGEQLKTDKCLQLLKECATKQIGNMSASGLVNCWSTLPFFSTEADTPLSTGLWMELCKPHHSFTIEEIQSVQAVLRDTSRVTSIQWTNQHFQKLMLEDAIEKDENSVMCVINVMKSSRVTVDFRNRVFDWILAALLEKHQHYTAKVYINVLEMLQYTHQWNTFYVKSCAGLHGRLMDKVIVYCMENTDNFTRIELGHIANKCNSMGNFYLPWSEGLCKKAYENFFKEPKSLLEFTFMLNALPTNMIIQTEVVNRIQTVFADRVNEFCPYLLPRICQSTFRIGPLKVHDQVKDLASRSWESYIKNRSFSEYRRVLSYINQFSTGPYDLDSLKAVLPTSFVGNSEYILYNMYFWGDRQNHKELKNALDTIRNCSESDILLLLKGFWLYPQKAYKSRQMRLIMKAVYYNIRKDPSRVYMCLRIFSTPNMPYLLECLLTPLMPNFVQISHDMSLPTFINLIKVCVKYGLYTPVLSNNLISFVLKEEFGLKYLSRYLYRVGANVPVAAAEAVVRLLENRGHLYSLYSKILMLHALCHVQIFPTRLLEELFTLETLTQIDRLIQDSPDKLHVVEFMMTINRAVVLERPDLKIPWLFDSSQFSTKWLKSPKDTDSRDLNKFIWNMEYTFGMDMFGQRIFSEYMHVIDFLLLMDRKSKKMVHFSMEKLAYAETLGLDKIAIVLLYQSEMLISQPAVPAKVKSRIRQLQVLGYKPVLLNLPSLRNSNNNAVQSHLLWEVWNVTKEEKKL